MGYKTFSKEEIMDAIDKYIGELYVIYYNPNDFTEEEIERIKREANITDVYAHKLVPRGQVVAIRNKYINPYINPNINPNINPKLLLFDDKGDIIPEERSQKDSLGFKIDKISSIKVSNENTGVVLMDIKEPEFPPLTIEEIYKQLEWWENVIEVDQMTNPTSEHCWEISEDVADTLRDEWIKVNDKMVHPLNAPTMVGELRGYPFFVNPTKKRFIKVWKDMT